MPGYISQWWDSLTKKYKEVSKEDPFPVTMIGGGAGGAEEVIITGPNGDVVPSAANNDSEAASTVALPTKAYGYHWDSADWNRNYGGGYAAHNSAITSQHVNARILGVNGPNAIPLQADANGNLFIVYQGSVTGLQTVVTTPVAIAAAGTHVTAWIEVKAWSSFYPQVVLDREILFNLTVDYANESTGTTVVASYNSVINPASKFNDVSNWYGNLAADYARITITNNDAASVNLNLLNIRWDTAD